MKHILAILVLIGSTFAQTTYKDGTDCVCDYIQTAYWDNGVVKTETPITNGDTLGWIVRYLHTGEIYSKELFTTIGSIEFYYYSMIGVKTRHYFISSDYRRLDDGTWVSDIDIDTTWYDNGQVSSISYSERNSKDYKCDTWKAVVFTRYYTNGKIKSVRSPLSNKCIQTDSYYDSLGNLKGVTKYKNAVLVSNTCIDGRFGNESLNCLN